MARVVVLLSYGWLFCIQLSLQFSYFEPFECNTGDSCEHCNITARGACAGKLTAPYLFCDPSTNLVSQSASMSLECWQGYFRIKHCAKNTYYIKDRGCVDPTIMPFMQGLSVSGSGRVGDVCQYNTDCLSGMYCSAGMCTCLSTYILRESYCYEKINPNQPGCTYDVQCESVWPGAKCSMDSSVGTCRCPEETHVARETRDGWVCISLKDQGTGGTAPLYFVCPLPEGAGFKIALNDPNPDFGSFPVSCTVGSSATVEPISGLHGGAACMWPSNGEFLGDIYDCIHTSPHVQVATKFPQSSYAASADGVCCPSRTLACIQPQATGPNPTESRWWYNSVTGTCQQFMWDPAATEAKYHSANNFKTIQHCESYCRDTCQRGPPQYSNEAVVHSERPLTTCSTTGCANDFQCTAVGSQHLCCPTPAVVCSIRGGRPYDLASRLTVFHQGFKVTTGKETIRFYYDPLLGRCHDFIYQGAGGNFNNFLSKHECEMFCSRLQCERGSPLRIGEGSQRCQSNAQCPSSHECKADQGVCCPRKQTICAQPLRVGDCTENVKRYYYNAKSRQCQMFEYTGCQGNDNNFDSHMDCQNFCKNAIPEPKCVQGQAYKDQFGNFVSCSNGMGCPANYDCTYDGSQWGCCPLKSYTCTLNSDSGVQCGAGSTFKFFYNPSTQNCESFQYNGCDGNSNNFATRESCEAYCSVGGCPNGGLPQRDHAGMMTVCGSSQRCSETHECVPVFSGVTMIHRCCPTRAYMCSLPPQQGTQCAANFVTRYYFNIVTGQCATFQFGGCDGNNNNFLTIQQCRSFCMSNSCPAGNIAYVDPNTQMPINCNEALSNSCPSGFTCTFNPLINNHVCCGATDLGVCPDGEKAYIDTFDMTARECAINIEASCPSNYLCRFHMQKNKYYCCASHTGKTCPVGKFLFKDSRTSHPTRCTMGRADQCPDGYSCQSYLSNALQGFCCSASSICPDDAEYVVDDISMQPRACTMGTFVSCPAGFSCRSASSSTEGFCCRSGITTTGIISEMTDGCPPGNYVHMLNGEIAQCDPFNPPNAPCPASYTCQWSTENQRYQCCGSNPLPPPIRTNDGCPSGQVAFREKESVRVCTAGSEQSCPSGYFCQFSSVNHQFQCCGVSGGCMNNAVAFIGVSGEPEKCVVGQSNCPLGFACKRSLAGHHVCCTKENVASCTEDEIELDGSCHQRVSPGDNCIADEQCMGGSVCREGMCVCPAKTTLVGGFCQKEIACAENQILFTGMCHNMARVGEGCVVGKQCPDGAGCMDGVCECKRGLIERKGACIAQPNQIVQSKLTTATCSKSGSKPLRDEETGRVIYCSLSLKACPSGYHCQINAKKTQYMCCSDLKEIAESTTTIATTSVKNVCPFGRIPYLVNGATQKCNGQRCPQGYECLYKNQNYYCCSTKSSTARTTKAEHLGIVSKLEDECLRGAVLIHPSTRTPVLCNPGSRSCPIGYACQKSLKSVSYVCCSSKNSDRPYSFHRFAAAPCEGFNVLVSRIINGRIEKQCERSCPHPQVAIGGICFEMNNYAKQLV